MLNVIRLLIFSVAVALLVTATVRAEVYRNQEFGITITVPEGAVLCPVPKEQHDHGPLFLLGTSHLGGCTDSERNRLIVVFAGYNAADVTKKLHDFMKWQCINIAEDMCGVAPSDLRITGLPSEAARVDRPNRWIDIIVVTQAGTPDPSFDSSVPSINYTLRLHTRAEYLEEDLYTFRIILNTIRLSPK